MATRSLVLALLLVACGGGGGGGTPRESRKAQAKGAQQKAAQHASKGEEEGGASQYVYNPIGKRDPFQSYIAQAEAASIESPTPLQKYDIEQYTLTGIIWGSDQPRALVEDPDGEGHVVEIGTYIGKNWGKVTRITDGEIVVTEEYLTPAGNLVVNPIEIRLKSSEEGK